MLESIDAVATGDTTLAELEGLTAAEAYAIADFGWTMLGQGRIEAAAAIFESLTISNPRHAYFHALFGSALQKLGDHEAALKAYGRALSIDPNETGALVNRAEMLLGLESCDPDEVTDLLGRSLSLDPDADRPETRRARALIAAVAAEKIAPEGAEVDMV